MPLVVVPRKKDVDAYCASTPSFYEIELSRSLWYQCSFSADPFSCKPQ